MNLWLPKFRDWREPRDWKRIWKDPAGKMGMGECCCTVPSSSLTNITTPCCANPFPQKLTATLSKGPSGNCSGFVGLTIPMNYSATASEADFWVAGICYLAGHPFVGGWSGTATLCNTVYHVGLWCNNGSPYNCPKFNFCVSADAGGDCRAVGGSEQCSTGACNPINITGVPGFTASLASCGCCGGLAGTVKVVITE